MATPHQEDQLLEAARNETLVETNAQAIFENLRKLGAFHAVHRRRWIWELLQNAADATDATTGKNRVRINAEAEKMSFSHCGSAFSPREISHLIYHGSSKQGDDSKRGKFGSGFLTIHLVSHKVRILGVLEKNGNRESFEFFLDRSGEAPQGIQEKMEIAWGCFMQSLGKTNSSGDGEFTTVFECDLDSDAGIVVESGLTDLARTVPYVLAFVDELDEVTVSTISGTKSWRRRERRHDGELTITEVASDDSRGLSEVIRVAVIGDHAKSVALAVLLRQTGEQWEVVVEDSTPRLFYPLPLVDTHDMPVPFAIASDGFEPREERNGILAGAADGTDKPTEKNWMLLRQVPLLYKTLIEACIREHWLAPHKLAKFEKVPTKEWLDSKSLVTEVLSKTIEFLRNDEAPGFVFTNGDKFIRVVDALIPVKDSSHEIYTLAAELTAFKDRLPVLQIADDWANILQGWAGILGKNAEQFEEALTAEKLAIEITPCKSLDDLAARLTSEKIIGALKWLNCLYGCVPPEGLRAFVQARSILPNQKGQLKKSGDLQLDGGIEDDIKDICDKLGADIRSQLLHNGVSKSVIQLFEGEKGKTLSNENCVEWALKKIKEPPVEVKGETYAEANKQLLYWLIEHDRKEELAGYPMLCGTGRSELRTDKPLLTPVSLWEQGAQSFADLFQADRQINEKYATFLPEKHWQYLEDKGLVLRSLFTTEPLDSFEQDNLTDDSEHKPVTPTKISQIVFIKGEDGLLDGLRKSKSKGKQFLKFLFQYVIKSDKAWLQGTEVDCVCGKKHQVCPAWMFLVKTRPWVSVGRRGEAEKPSAENVAALLDLDIDLKNSIFNDADCAQFLLKIGIGISDLVRIGVPEEKRFQLDQLSARIYGSADELTMESIEAVLDNPDIKEAVLNKKHEKEKVARNHKVGKLVEQLLSQELMGVGIHVERTGVGSDFELDTDFVENGREQILKVSRYLLEVKSTSAAFVRMTLRQGEEAVKSENRDNYLLCVVDVSAGIINEQIVKEKASFVFGVGPMVEVKVNDAKGLKDHEANLKPDDGGVVGIEINDSSVKLRIKQQVWLKQGVSFESFVERVKQQK
jgi:hypothetical protein